MASEILVFLISDLDRMHIRERQYSCPVSYAMKGYSMTTEVMRKMIADVLDKCFLSQLYIPLVSYDGQWYNMVVRSRQNEPLTILQLQKDVWKEAKKMKKGKILKDIQMTNIIQVKTFTDFQELVKCSQTSTIKNKVKYNLIDVFGLKKTKAIYSPSININQMIKSDMAILKESENTSSMKKNILLDSLPSNVADSLDENMIDKLVAVVNIEEGNNTISDFTDGIEPLFYTDAVLTTGFTDTSNANVQTDTESMETSSQQMFKQNDQQISNMEPVLCQNDVRKMLEAIIQKRPGSKWESCQLEDFMVKLRTADSIRGSLTKEEHKICIDVAKEAFLPVVIQYSVSWKKDKLLDLLDKLCRKPFEFQGKIKNGIQKKPLNSLKTLCFRQVSKLPKYILNCVRAEHIFPNRLMQWMSKSPFANVTKIDGLDEELVWYSMPEFDQDRVMHYFHVLDSHHLFTNARVKCCNTGIVEAGIRKEAWIKVARDSFHNNSGLSMAIVEDLVDKQSNAFAQKTFSGDVEDIMHANGDHGEAKFCSLIRRWYEAEDLPGLSADERCTRRLDFRKWLLKDISFNS